MSSDIQWTNLRRKLVERIYPEEEDLESLREAYENYADFIRDEGFETFFAGSAGRGTCRRGDRDIDLFVLFPEDIERSELEKKGLNIGRKLFEKFNGEYEVEYAEHPYTKGIIDGKEVEVVPCIDTSPENIRTAVDRSPHHAKWVRNNLNQEQKEDVVLLKAFLEASDIYGSSLKIRGFSGYLCEVLVHEYGDIESLLKHACKWRERTLIDPENHHEDGLPEELEKKFKHDDLVVIDPVDPDRNVASVLTTENYSKFVFEAHRFVDEPGVDLFEKQDTELDKFLLKKEVEKRGNFTVFEFNAPERPDDILYPQLRKFMRRIEAVLQKHDFEVYESGFHVSETVKIFFETQSDIPKINLKKGPKPVHGRDHMREFNEKYSNVSVKNDRLVAKIEREFTEPKALIKDFLDDEPKQLREKGVPDNIAERLNSFKIVDVLTEDEQWLKFLTEKLRIQ